MAQTMKYEYVKRLKVAERVITNLEKQPERG